MSKYLNTSDARIRGGGGHTRVTIGTTTDNRGNGGTSLPCSGCWVSCAIANTEVVRMNIDVAASDTVGMDLGRALNQDGEGAGVQPLWVPIDDVASLHFYSADDNAIIDIIYLLG